MINKGFKYVSENSGLISFACFWLAIVSGFGLVTVFDIQNPMESLNAIQTHNPYGLFLHSLHYWSAQICFVFTIVHLFEKMGNMRSKNNKAWIYGVISLPILFLVMISGYIVKGDQHGMLAHNILLSLSGKIPLVKDIMACFFSTPKGSLLSFYINHVSVLTIGCLLIIILHSKKIFLTQSQILKYWSFALLCSLFFPPQIITSSEVIQRSPWYLLFFQEILHWSDYPQVPLIMLVLIFGLLLWFPLRSLVFQRWFRRLMIIFLIMSIGLTLFVVSARSKYWQLDPKKAIWTEEFFFSPTIFLDIGKY